MTVWAVPAISPPPLPSYPHSHRLWSCICSSCDGVGSSCWGAGLLSTPPLHGPPPLVTPTHTDSDAASAVAAMVWAAPAGVQACCPPHPSMVHPSPPWSTPPHPLVTPTHTDSGAASAVAVTAWAAPAIYPPHSLVTPTHTDSGAASAVAAMVWAAPAGAQACCPPHPSPPPSYPHSHRLWCCICSSCDGVGSSCYLPTP